MYPTQIDLYTAMARNRDLLAEAEQARRLDRARRTQSASVVIRHATRLIARPLAGQRIPEPAAV